MTPGRAIGWEFLRRHRLGLSSLTLYFVAAAAYKIWMLGRGADFSMERQVEYFVFGAAIPMGVTLMYLMAVFTYGLSGDFGGRQSTFPARMLALPVRTNALAGWPMLYGTLAMVAVCAALRVVGLWPQDEHVPIVWPVLLGAVYLAWTQALTWMPYGLPGLRVVAALFLLTLLEIAVVIGLHFRIAEWIMIAVLAPLLPLAYRVACVAVARARHGDTPDWRGAFAWRLAFGRRATRPLASAASAQAWFEWTRYGWSLPVLVGILLPFELALLAVADDALSLVITILLCVLLTPPFLASFTAAAVRKTSSDTSDSYNISPFIATRPLTGAALIAAKLRMTVASTLLTWAMVLAAIPLGLAWTGAWPMVSARARDFAAYWGTARAVAVLALIIAIFMLSTWRQLVQSLYLGLSGRAWVVKWSVGIALTFLSLVAPLAIWVVETPAAIRFLMEHFKAILGVLALLKTAVAMWIAVRLWRTRVLTDRTLVTGAATWLAAVGAFYGVLAWLFYGRLFPDYLFAFMAILLVPLARLSAAPLALDRNRHR